MKIVETADKITQVKEYPGLFRCDLVHELKASSAVMHWEGPKFPKQMWEEVLAFFKWTQDSHDSESQVRLFVNTKTRTWKAHAFPQEERTGMSALELPDLPEYKAQRADFKDSEGWLYYGTIHHHCKAGAFQSGTDLANERDQDGIHITVGHMDQLMHDLHSRFYMCRMKFEPDMSLFWPLDYEVLDGVPLQIAAMLPSDWRHKLAVLEMGTQPPAETEFPEQWKKNVVPVKKTVTVYGSGVYKGGNYFGHKTEYSVDTVKDKMAAGSNFGPRAERIEGAVADLRDEIKHTMYKDEDIINAITDILKTHHKRSLFDEVLRKKEVSSFEDVTLIGETPKKKLVEALKELKDSWICDDLLGVCIAYDVSLFEIREELKKPVEDVKVLGNGEQVQTDFAGGYGYGYGES